MQTLFSKYHVYNTRYFVYTYNDNNIRIVKLKNSRKPGYELLQKFKSHIIENGDNYIDYNSEEVKRCSLSRTKRNIRELCLCNDFTYFVTLTICNEKADRYNLDIVQSKLKKVLKKIKRNNSNFKYLFITEKHKDGAFHFHGLIGGLSPELFIINNYGYLEIPLFTNELGFNSISKIRDYTRTCNYITKYITKDCVKNSHNQIYISSRGLKKASKEEFNYLDFTPSYSNDYCDILDISLDNLSREENLKLFYQLKEGK